MRNRRGLLRVGLVVLLLGSPAFAAEGDNVNVDGDLYIPFNTDGILNDRARIVAM